MTDIEATEMFKDIMDDGHTNDEEKIIINDVDDTFTNNTSYRQRKIDADNYRKVEILRWTRNPESIKIDENGNVFCQAWGNYRILGTGNIVETTELINRYIDECGKLKEQRDFSFITLIEQHHEDKEKNDNKLLIAENALIDFI